MTELQASSSGWKRFRGRFSQSEFAVPPMTESTPQLLWAIQCRPCPCQMQVTSGNGACSPTRRTKGPHNGSQNSRGSNQQGHCQKTRRIKSPASPCLQGRWALQMSRSQKLSLSPVFRQVHRKPASPHKSRTRRSSALALPIHCEARKACSTHGWPKLPSHQLRWKCAKPLSKRKVVFVQGLCALPC